MTDTVFNAAGTERTATIPSGIRSIQQWLEMPLAPQPADELPLLRAHLKALREIDGTLPQRVRILDGLYSRSTMVTSRLIPSLSVDLVLPVPRKTRRIVRSLLDLLQMLADDTLAQLDEHDRQHAPDKERQLALWRSVYVLAQQLMISDLIASPARAGTWLLLHQTYAEARRLQLHATVPRGEVHSLQHLYHAAILLGWAQPASLTAREVLFLTDYFERFANQIEPLSSSAAVNAATLCIDPLRDAAAMSSFRKIALPTADLDCYSIAGLCALLKVQIAQLDAGTPPQELNLPDFAGTPAGRGVLVRLSVRWSNSGKRRFQRRMQNQRALVGAGIDGLWQLSQKGTAANVELSTWMITNESPEGYSVMHVSGNIGALSVGDVAAVRTGSDQNWQICMVRWAVSENPEHLELGLQILAPRAVPAILAQPSDGSTGTEHLRVLILPEIPKLRTGQWLIVAAGALPKHRDKLLLVIEEENIAVREVKSIYVDEQTGSVEILSIEPDQDPF